VIFRPDSADISKGRVTNTSRLLSLDRCRTSYPPALGADKSSRPWYPAGLLPGLLQPNPRGLPARGESSGERLSTSPHPTPVCAWYPCQLSRVTAGRAVPILAPTHCTHQSTSSTGSPHLTLPALISAEAHQWSVRILWMHTKVTDPSDRRGTLSPPSIRSRTSVRYSAASSFLTEVSHYWQVSPA